MRKTGPWRDTRPTEPKPRRRKGGKPAPAPWETDPPGGSNRARARSAVTDAKPKPMRTPKTPKPSANRRVRRGKPGDLEATRREVWHALKRAGDLLDTATDPAEVIRAAHAIAGCANAYTKLTEASDLAARLAALEAAQAAQGGRT